MLKSSGLISRRINSNEELTEADDVSSVAYQPFQVNYMRDVFRRKVFVKQSAEEKESIQESIETPSNPLYKSIYDGMEVKEESHPVKSLGGMSEVEKQEAEKLMQRIIEIEKEHESSVKTAIVPDSSSPEFSLGRCNCPECSPRFLDDGSVYCELCQVPLVSEDWLHHQYSISHQFKRKLDKDHYLNSHMPTTSTAVKWMQSMGWKEGEGLGSTGRGRLEPIPTRMKNNRLGVGAKDDAPLRVTHTPHNGDADPTEDPCITKERERLLAKYGEKRLKRLVARFLRRKKEKEMRERELWLRDEFRLCIVCNKHSNGPINEPKRYTQQ